jgi:hypothetical protein
MDVEPETITMNKIWTIRLGVAAPPLFAVLFGAAVLLGVNDTLAQQVLVMQGIEKIDSKERISGNAVVGFSFIQKNCEKFDPKSVHVYTGTGSTNVDLTTRLATVDGRYVFNATLQGIKTGGWYRLKLEKKINESGSEVAALNTAFLNTYGEKQIAVLATDSKGRLYPVHCGCQGKLETIRIQVNAEGADAYYPDLGGDKPVLKSCNRVQQRSNFKFDHFCDVGAESITKAKETFPIIRKRGATIAKPIPIKAEIPAQNQNENQKIYASCTAAHGNI